MESSVDSKLGWITNHGYGYQIGAKKTSFLDHYVRNQQWQELLMWSVRKLTHN